MSSGLDARYYKLALYRARQRDLSGAVVFARRALIINPENEEANKLLGLCLFELGELSGAATALRGYAGLAQMVLAQRKLVSRTLPLVRELAGRKKWRRAEALLRNMGHQSVRILAIRGCLKAAANKHKAAVSLFTSALEKDRGNLSIQTYLLSVTGR